MLLTNAVRLPAKWYKAKVNMRVEHEINKYLKGCQGHVLQNDIVSFIAPILNSTQCRISQNSLSFSFSSVHTKIYSLQRKTSCCQYTSDPPDQRGILQQRKMRENIAFVTG